MLVESSTVSREAFEQGTGWQLKPEGACKGDVCIPLNPVPGDTIDVADLAGRMGLPLAKDEQDVTGAFAAGVSVAYAYRRRSGKQKLQPANTPPRWPL